HRIHRMAEADDDFFVFHTAADVGLGFVGGFVALLHFEGDFVGTTVLGPAQGADAPGNRRIHVGTRAGNDPAGEGGGVEFVLRVQNERGVHGAHPFIAWGVTVQQVQEVPTDAVVVGLHVDDAAVVAVVVPVQQGRAHAGHDAVGDVARIGQVVVVFLGQ